jgi:hypothetical protein
LTDSEPFLSYYPTRLYKRGYINRDRWRALHSVKFESDVDTLENIDFFDSDAIDRESAFEACIVPDLDQNVTSTQMTGRFIITISYRNP